MELVCRFKYQNHQVLPHVSPVLAVYGTVLFIIVTLVGILWCITVLHVSDGQNFYFLTVDHKQKSNSQQPAPVYDNVEHIRCSIWM